MPRIPRRVLPAALALLFLDVAVLATQPSGDEPVLATRPALTTTSTAAAPPTTATTLPPPTTTSSAAPRPTTTAAPQPATTAPAAAPATTAAPRPARSATKAESCGWAWDGIRIDDGSSNEVTMNLDAPRRPNETVTITAAFAGPDSPDASRTTTTDGDGQATVTFTVSEDKRDWTITISASFAAGGVCAPQTFTLAY